MEPQALGLAGSIVPFATYFDDSDCVEFVSEDTIAIHRRIDGFLTLILDDTRLRLIGFKLKGFKCIYNEVLKPLKLVEGVDFVELVPALQHVCTSLGKELVADEKRRQAYNAAMRLAKSANVRLYADERLAA